MVYSTSVFTKHDDLFSRKRLDTLMHLTLGQAAKAAQVSKSYLSKLIRTGKISATRQANGEFRIDPSELDRILAIRSQTHTENSFRERSDTPENTALEQERKLWQLLLAEREQQIRDLRSDRDAWRQQAERAQQTLLLSAGETRTETPTRRWWQWGRR